MEQEKNIILVTWDFTEKSEFAFEHALLAAKRLNQKVGLVHIVKKESEIEPTKERIREIISEKYPQITSKPELLVRAGNIFSTITEIANDLEAVLIFMGTHGIKGSQKFFGSWALKVIANTRTPFVVVQDKPHNKAYNDILFPINFKKENKESASWLHFFSKYFGATIEFLTSKHKDPNFIKGVESNILFLDKFLSMRGVSFKATKAKGEVDFPVEAIQHAVETKKDALVVVVTKGIGMADYMLGAQEQYIIANEAKLPVICINPKPPKPAGGFSASG